MYIKNLISVIVPIYNISSVLPSCLESILASTYKDLEIICVNDGSTDESLSVINYYANFDDRIVIIDKENGGLSEARNYGLQIASGEYIAFVDGDDYIHPKMYEILMQCFHQEEVDCVKCDYLKVFEINISVFKDISFEKEKLHFINSYYALKLLFERWDSRFKDYVWNGVYKHTLIEEYLFPLGKKYEDAFWSYKVYGSSKKIAIYSEPLYYYYQREDSDSHEMLNIRDLDNLEAKMMKLHYVAQRYLSLEALAAYDLYSVCMSMYIQLKDINDSTLIETMLDTFYKARSECRKRLDLIIQSKYLKRSQKLIVLLSMVSFRLGCNVKHQLVKINNSL